MKLTVKEKDTSVARLYLFLFIATLLSGLVGGAYYYYTDTQKKIAALSEENIILKLSTEQCTETLERVRANFSDVQRNVNELQRRLNTSENYKSQLQDKLQRHDLTNLTLKKPGLIERRINDATKQIFESLESDTAL